jgi:uncharacterized protein YaaR (DUF327 family)
MPAPIGNEYYKIRSKDGRGRKYETREELVEGINGYIDYCLTNPHQEQVSYHFQGIVTKDTEEKMRSFSVEGLCVFLEIAKSTFYEYEKIEDFSDIITRTREIIEMQQFEGAVSGFLNANIIARKLGLSEKTETNLKGKIDIEQITGMIIS